MTFKSFRDIEVWKLSIKLATDIYGLTNEGTFAKDYAFKDQIRRAVVSVSSNIAEGFDRNNNKEFIRFLKISKGSLAEVHSQIILAKELKYIDNPELIAEVEQLSNRIGKLISYLRSSAS